MVIDNNYERARTYVMDRADDFIDGVYSFQDFNREAQKRLSNWMLFPKDEQEKAFDTVRDQVLDNIRKEPERAIEITRDNLDDVIRQMDSLPEVVFPEPEQKGIISRTLTKIKNFLGGLF